MNIPASLLTTLQIAPIAFAEFMHLALYSSEFGYYTSGLPKLGPKGDFTTAPELTPLFGQTIANQCKPLLDALASPVMMEFGAGTGRLARDILLALAKLEALPHTYFILEVSPSLRAQQEILLKKELAHLPVTIEWLTSWPTEPFEGILLANEVLDAMPVHRFLQKDAKIWESFVTLSPDNTLEEIYLPCKNERLLAYLQLALAKEKEPYQSEANLMLEGFLQGCANLLQRGALLVIDYGFPRHEYYHEDRSSGTIMCHYQHKAHSNPFMHIGEQDISAHVDFTHVAEAAFSAGFHVAGYTHQAAFLLSCGMLQQLEALAEHALLKAKEAVKILLHPSEMGELCKVMMLTKDLDLPLLGFFMQDKRASL